MGIFGLSILLNLLLICSAFADTYVNVSGTWKPAESYVNVSGVWKPADAYCNVSGTWEPCSSGGCEVAYFNGAGICTDVSTSYYSVYKTYATGAECLAEPKTLYIRTSGGTVVTSQVGICRTGEGSTAYKDATAYWHSLEGVSYVSSWE